LYRALKHNGVECELIVYPREGHLPAQEKHRVTRLTISVAVWKRIAAAQGPMGEVASAALTGSSSATAAIKFTTLLM